MKKWLEKPIFIVACIIVMGLGIRHFFLEPIVAKPSNPPAQLSTNSFFASSFVDDKGVNQALSQYKGKILVVNFWATWCPPCREEMPELSKLHETHLKDNVVVLGLSTDELEEVKAFSKQSPVSYPLFGGGDAVMGLGQSLGNDRGVLPFTAIIRPDGSIAQVYFGRINQAVLAEGLMPIITAHQH
jgi:thiol-disulfide isomerase/thioredoxin